MIVDCHNHIGDPSGANIAQTPEELLEKMDRAGVDKSIVFAFPYENYDNEYVLDAVEQYSDRFIGFAVVAPWMHREARKYTRECFEKGFKGVKLHAAAHGYKMGDVAVIRDIMEVCDEKDAPVIAYSGDELYATPLQFTETAKAFPDVPIIMAHSGFMMHTPESIAVAKECPNIYLEQSSAISLGLEATVDELGPERVIFGSDSPHMDPDVEIYKINLKVPDQKARELILGENVMKLLN